MIGEEWIAPPSRQPAGGRRYIFQKHYISGLETGYQKQETYLVRIREYLSDDFDELWRLDQECFPRDIAYSRFELMRYIRRRGAFTLIAEADNASIRGFIVGECRNGVRAATTGRGTVGHIITIDVAGSARRTGLGTLLMDAAEARMREQQCEVVYLETAVDNRAAIAFYKGRGYTLLSTIPRYYPGGLDAFVMGKKLSEVRAAQGAESAAK